MQCRRYAAATAATATTTTAGDGKRRGKNGMACHQLRPRYGGGRAGWRGCCINARRSWRPHT